MLKKRNLLLLASIVWFIAGINVLLIGIKAYRDNFSIMNLVLSVVIFIIFFFMIFNKLVIKHTKRIKAYKEEMQYFYHFFDLKSFIIMAFMMTLGIVIRKYSLMSDSFIAFFYTGLGAALALAGVRFFINYLKY